MCIMGHIPAAEYRKVIVGLIFLRYISAAFDKRYKELVEDGDGFEDDIDAYTMFFWYVLLKKRQKEIFDAQTGSARPHIYPQHIAAMPLNDIAQKDISAFTQFVTPLFKVIGHNKEENAHLVDLRDSLLPKLMSGELDISDIDL